MSLSKTMGNSSKGADSLEKTLEKLRQTVQRHTYKDNLYDNAVENVGASLKKLVHKDASKEKLAVWVLTASAAKIQHGSEANDREGFIASGQFDDFIASRNPYYSADQVNEVGISRNADDTAFVVSIGGRGRAIESFDIAIEDSQIVHDIRGFMELTQGAVAKNTYSNLVRPAEGAPQGGKPQEQAPV